LQHFAVISKYVLAVHKYQTKFGSDCRSVFSSDMQWWCFTKDARIDIALGSRNAYFLIFEVNLMAKTVSIYPKIVVIEYCKSMD